MDYTKLKLRLLRLMKRKAKTANQLHEEMARYYPEITRESISGFIARLRQNPGVLIKTETVNGQTFYKTVKFDKKALLPKPRGTKCTAKAESGLVISPAFEAADLKLCSVLNTFNSAVKTVRIGGAL